MLQLAADALTSARFVEGDSSYLAAREAQSVLVGAYIDRTQPGTIFYNPKVLQHKDLRAMVLHEGMHLAGLRGHVVVDGKTVYGPAMARDLARPAGFSSARDNASNYACAAFRKANGC